MKKIAPVFLLLITIMGKAQNMPSRTILPGDTLTSLKLSPDRKVTFSIYAPNANEITVGGDFLTSAVPQKLTKSDNGVWSVTVGPLNPELYSYTFNIDGVKVIDPRNNRTKRDGARIESILFVPGEASALYEVKDVPHGNVSKVWYQSPTLALTRRMYVYTPPGYESSEAKYPVLYLLHGAGGDEDAWSTLGRAPQILDNLIAEKKAVPMIVVMTNGNPSQSVASPDGGDVILSRLPGAPRSGSPAPGANSTTGLVMGKFEESLVHDVVPYIEKNYRVRTNTENRAIAGLSMGGGHTAKTVFNNPGMFNYIGVFSGASINPSEDQLKALKDKNPKLFWIGCGVEDRLLPGSKSLSESLNKFSIKNTYSESPGGHTWRNWRVYFSEITPLLFKDL